MIAHIIDVNTIDAIKMVIYPPVVKLLRKWNLRSLGITPLANAL
jgi:hypothetical protein